MYQGFSITARESHCRHVNGGHLRREHRLHLVLRFDTLHNGEHEIEPVLVRRAALRSGIDELLEEPVQVQRGKSVRCRNSCSIWINPFAARQPVEDPPAFLNRMFRPEGSHGSAF
jgi:hypothetical protein